ncbi:MAG: hypothetical protein Q7T93_16410 [Methylobacterium sp.]|uniref:hypothetical protein n=1 Tax=Methylobacterium sp. TaxID=409 RepID=UPI00271E5408|nr:hypothetical protein [Methylobacterium sp.]MDO9428400.1 hypothetical protein [Methylobacterium sp.]
MTDEGNIQRARVLLQQCARLGAIVDRGARHVAASIGISLEPRSYSFISAPNDLAYLSSIEGHWIKNEFGGYPTRIKHDQVNPKIRALVYDAPFDGVLIDRDKSERTYISRFINRKRRCHSKAPPDRHTTQSSVCNLCGKSLTKHEKNQPSCEHFPEGDMPHFCSSTGKCALYSLYPASTTDSRRQAVVKPIPHSLAKHPLAGYSRTLTCANRALREGPGHRGYIGQLHVSHTFLLVPVLLFLGFRTWSIARPFGGLPYRAVVGIARGYGRSAHVRLRVLLALAPRLIVGRFGQVLVRCGHIGHATLSGLASNALSTGTVR